MCFNGCNEALIQEEPASSGSLLTIDQARAFIESQTRRNTLKSAETSGLKMNFFGDWVNAHFEKNEKFDVVVSPIFADHEFGYATAKSFSDWEKTKDEQLSTSRSMYVTIKEKSSGETYGCIMTIIGDSYTAKSDTDADSYLVRDPNFCGYVLFYNLDGTYSSGWKYNNGQITHKVTPEADKTETATLKAASISCHKEYIARWVDICWTYEYGYMNGSGGVVTTGSNGERCQRFTKWMELDVCVTTYVNDAPQDHYTPGTGLPSDNFYGDPKTATNVEKIQNNNSLDPTQKALLENAMNTLVAEHKMTKAVFDRLVNLAFKISFVMKTDQKILRFTIQKLKPYISEVIAISVAKVLKKNSFMLCRMPLISEALHSILYPVNL